MASRVKGATQLRTLASLKKSGGHAAGRHVTHFKVASLELERSRRLKEKQEALIRIQSAEERIREIETLLKDHYETLGLEEPPGEGEAGMDNAEASRPHPVRAARVEEPRPAYQAPRQMLIYGR